MPTLFLYGELGPGGDVAAWTTGLDARPATVRGALWSDARRHALLVPTDGRASVAGVLVDVDPARQAVLTVLLGTTPPEHGLTLPDWRPVQAAAGLRPVSALAWSLPSPRAARLAGYRPPRGPRIDAGGEG